MKTINIPMHQLPLYVVSIVFFLMLLSGIFVPIYSDEIAIHLSRSRYLFDSWKITGLFPQCDSSWLRSPFWSEYPAAILHFLFRPSADPLYLRGSGIAFALAWFFLLWYFLGKVVQERTMRLLLWSLAVAVCALGPLPYVMVLARPEQVLLLLLTLFCIICLYFAVLPGEKIYKTLAKLAVFFCILSALYFAHPKAIFFAPLAFVALYLFSLHSNIVVRVLSMLLALAVTYQAVKGAMTVTQCPEAPGVVRVLSDKAVDLTRWHSAPDQLIEKMFINIGVAVDQNIFRLAFSDSYQSFWIPSTPIVKSSALIKHLNAANRVALYFLYCAGAALVIIMTWRQLNLGGDYRRHLLALSLLLGLVANAAIFNKVAWNFYTPGLMIPLFIFTVLLVVPDFINLFKQKLSLVYAFVLPWCILAIFNLIVLGATVTPGLTRIAQDGNLIIQEQLISAPVFLNQQSRETLDYLVQECGLPRNGASRLAVDGASYGYMNRMHQPISVLYVSIAYGMDIPDLGVFLHNIQSDGILSRCDYLPAPIASRSLMRNNICCLSRDDLSGK